MPMCCSLESVSVIGCGVQAVDTARNSLLKTLESLVDSERHSDVTLMCRDNNVVHAHRLLLATRCPQLYLVICIRLSVAADVVKSALALATGQ